MMIKKIFLLLISIYLLIPLFDKSIWTESELDRNMINKRYGYFSQEMGKLYTNNKLMRFYLNKVFPITNKYFSKLAHPK